MWYLQATCSKILEKNRAERTIIGRLECFSSEVFDERLHTRHSDICTVPKGC